MRWVSDCDAEEGASISVEPIRFYLERLEWLGSAAKRAKKERDWSRRAVVYNLFVRGGAAFDHDGDGEIGGAPGDPTLNGDGHRETGTFLKAIALLPHIARMGVNTLHLLPITAIGASGRKGELGSPYAIRNLERLEPTLADPILGDLPVEAQFAALTEAAHRVGMRIVLEFVFRTAALDSDWIKEHPEWFYWIDRRVPNRDAEMADRSAGFGAPIFGRRELAEIVEAVTGPRGEGPLVGAALARRLSAGKGRLHPPPARYRGWFAAPPKRVGRGRDSEVIGFGEGKELRVPPAFADWPPDDDQPPWTDVTYLRMYESDEFNYMAYNTLRAYDPTLGRSSNELRPLWDRIARVVPDYQRRYGIDGVMIDMGHSLPARLLAAIIARARAVDPAVALWEECFSVRRQSASAGYDATVGELIFTAHRPESFRELVRKLRRPVPLSFFATIENHNTPRAAGRGAGSEVGFAAWALSVFLPGAIPFIHAGFELADTTPINTGLDFGDEDLRRWRNHPLALFDRAALSWNKTTDLPDRIARVLDLRARIAPALAAGERPPIAEVDAIGDGAVAFRVDGGAGNLLLAASLDDRESALIPNCEGVDLWTGATIEGCAVLLGPGKWIIVQECG